MRFNDAIFGAALIVFAVAEMLYTRTFPSLHGQAYGPDLFPRLIGAGLIICGLALVINGVLARQTTPWIQLGEWAGDRRARINFALVLCSLVLYILLSTWVGFVPISILILSLLLYRFGVPWLPAAGLAVVVTFVIYLLFSRLLLVPLPLGVLQ